MTRLLAILNFIGLRINDGARWFVIGFVVWFALQLKAYLWLHPSDLNYGVFAGALATCGAIYHWCCVYDDKHPDAGNGDPPT
jgi:hypothetical protein